MTSFNDVIKSADPEPPVGFKNPLLTELYTAIKRSKHVSW